MPLFNKRKISDHATLAIWHIKESDKYFTENLELTENELLELERINGSRRTEWLSARMLLQEIFNDSERQIIVKDEFGKPHLNSGLFHISISHSFDFSAILISKKNSGIDIQKHLPKIDRIKTKFLGTNELEAIDVEFQLEYLHFYWGAKESIYKAYGKKRVHFSNQIFIEPFELKNDLIQTSGTLNKDENQTEYEIFGELFSDYYLVYAFEK